MIMMVSWGLKRRLILALGAIDDYKVYPLDIDNAFFNCKNKEKALITAGAKFDLI
jgi:hypothetical protein